MYPLHGIRGSKWKAAGQHLVQHDTKRIKISSRIDRTIHASSLFGRHVGERPGDGLWRLKCLPLTRNSRRDPEAREPHVVSCGVHENIGGLDILVDECAFVEPAKRGRKSDSDA